MVESQIRPNKVSDPAIIEAILAVPRERFVPASLRGIAYVDEDIPLGGGRYLMEPMVFGRLLQVAAIGRQDIVLDVGCGSGYASAVMARLARKVIALEEEPALAHGAAARFAELAISNAVPVKGPLASGWPLLAPYDVILFNGAVAAIPPVIAGQLAKGGRLVAVVQAEPGMGKAGLKTRVEGDYRHRTLFIDRHPILQSIETRPDTLAR